MVPVDDPNEPTRQEKMNSPRPQTKAVRIDRVTCPLHVLQLKNGLKKIDVCETLRVIPGSAAVVTELVAACHSLGHESVMIDNEGRQELIVTKMH
jgi:TusA-related sulfurtransferase